MIFAYSPFVRALFWLAYRYLAVCFVTYTSLYDRNYLRHDSRTVSLTKKMKEKVRKLKADAMVKKSETLAQNLRDEREMEKRQGMKQEQEGGSGIAIPLSSIAPLAPGALHTLTQAETTPAERGRELLHRSADWQC